jgi:hypothetical protein
MNGIPAIHLGGNYMKFTPAFLLCAAILIAALPIQADSLAYTGTAADDSRNTQISAPELHASATTTKTSSPATPRVIAYDPLAAVAPVRSHEIAYLALPAAPENTGLSVTSVRRPVAPQIDGQLSDPTPAITSIGGFDPSSSFAAWDSGPSFISATFFPPSGDVSVHSSAPNEINSGDAALSEFATEGARHNIDRERGKGDNGKNQIQTTSPSVEVSEPAALPLLLFGLAALGILARRRNVFPTAA